MKYIVGLGNPGLGYRATKHNIGFEVVRKLAKEMRIRINEKRHFSLMGRGKIGREEAVLVLPQTFMNLTGNAVGELFEHEIRDIRDMVVVCDDINLELGKIRLRKQGSSGGHKGLESIMHTLNRDDFPRLRVGIATEAHRGDITHYVLTPFRRRELRNAAHAVNLAKDALVCLLEEGADKAMAKFNKRRAGTS